MMTDGQNAQFRKLTESLVAQGEDKDEMEYWADIFPDLPSKQREELFKAFAEELRELQAQER